MTEKPRASVAHNPMTRHLGTVNTGLAAGCTHIHATRCAAIAGLSPSQRAILPRPDQPFLSTARYRKSRNIRLTLCAEISRPPDLREAQRTQYLANLQIVSTTSSQCAPNLPLAETRALICPSLQHCTTPASLPTPATRQTDPEHLTLHTGPVT